MMTCEDCGCQDAIPVVLFGKIRCLCSGCYYFTLDGDDLGDIPESVSCEDEEG